MSSSFKKLISFLSCLMLLSYCSAQIIYANDAQLRTDVSLSKKLNDFFSLQVQEQARWSNNISSFERASTDLSFSCAINKRLKITSGYVHIYKMKNAIDASIRHRFYLSLTLKADYYLWKFQYRCQLQNQLNDPFFSKYGTTNYIYNRHKITVKYEISKRLSVYLADELYLPLNNPGLLGFDRNRFYVGCTYKISKKQSVDVYFMNQRKLQFNDWPKYGADFSENGFTSDYVCGLSYAVEF